ncbi:hypothetical protein [Flavobacterium sp. 3-210]
MEIEIIEKQEQCLFVYEEDELLFYSTVKFNWFSRIIKIYNPFDVLVLELKFDNFSYQVLHQNKFMTKDVYKIDEKALFFNKDKRLYIKSKWFITFNHNFNYFFKGNKIADVKQNIWSLITKYQLNINNESLEFRNQLIFHVLAIKTGYSVD